MIARVRFGQHGSRCASGVMLPLSASTSAKTGVAPALTTEETEAMKVRGVTITSSPVPDAQAGERQVKRQRAVRHRDRVGHADPLGELALERAALAARPVVHAVRPEHVGDGVHFFRAERRPRGERGVEHGGDLMPRRASA